MKQLYQKLHTKLRELETEAIKRPVKFFLVKLAFLAFHFSLVLFKSSGEGFNIITNNSEKVVCPYSYVHYKKYQKKARVFSAAAAATTVIVLSVILSLVLNLLFGIILPSQAATYTWTQTNWATLTANTTGHPAPANWTEYSAKDANLTTVNAGADLQLVSAPTVNEYTIGALANINVDTTAVTDNSNGTWTITLGAADLSRIFKNDKFKDEASPQKSWKILSSFDSANKIIVWDSEGNGGAPSAAGATQATVGRWYASISLWETGREGNLVTRGAIERGLPYYDGAADTTAVTIDGWTTDATHYVEIYVPLSERHRGNNSSGYKLAPTSDWQTLINFVEDYGRIEGLVFQLTQNNNAGINYTGFGELNIANNIIYSTAPAPNYGGIALTNIGINGKAKIWNNIIDNVNVGIFSEWGPVSTIVVYNNTILNSVNKGISFDGDSYTAHIKNNLIQGTNTNYSILRGTGNTTSNNISQDATSPDAALRNKTVPFVDSTNKDFHLEFRDGTGNPAMNAGADLSADANLAFTTDIDNDTRSGTWDIGADDVGATLVKVHSIGTTSRNFATLQGWENARDGVLTTRNVFKTTSQTGGAFAAGQTIKGCTSAATGTYIPEQDTPSATETYMTLDSVTGTFSASETVMVSTDSCATPTGPRATLSTILTTAGTIERGEGYNDGTPDASMISISGWVTDSTHYPHVYVPHSQRHRGTVDSGGYLLRSTSGAVTDNLYVSANYTVLEGLKIERTSSNSAGWAAIKIATDYNTGKFITIRDNLLVQSSGGGSPGYDGLISQGGGNTESDGARVYNNIIISNSSSLYCAMRFSKGYDRTSSQQSKYYNNTIYGSFVTAGFCLSPDSTSYDAYKPLVSNNYIANTGTGVDFNFTNYDNTLSNFSYNRSDDTTAGSSNNNSQLTVANAKFVDSTLTTGDFHILPSSPLKDAGTSLSSTFTTDIDSQTRPVGSAWDIGADEFYPVYQYPTSQTLTSSGYNSTDTANVIGALSWTEDVSLPTGTTVTVSLRAATSSANLTSSSWNDFTNATANCSKTTGTVTCSLAAIPASLKDGTGDQWFQYKVTLTSTGASTPTLAAVTVSYVVNSPPVISNLTASQGSDGVVSVGYDFSDSDNSSATVGLFADIGLAMSDNPLSSTATSMTISSASLLPSTGTVLLDSEEITYTGKTSNTLTGLTRAANTTTAASHTQNTAVWIKGTTVFGNVGASTATGTGKTASWTIATDLPNIENSSAKILVLANDLNLANQVGTGQSSTLTLDTKVPAVSSLVIDASQTPAALTFSVSDLSSLQYKVGLSSGAGAFTSYSTSTAITITATDPSTVYYTFKDAKGNQTTGSQATMETPATFMVQDVSNLKSNATSTYQLFSAWQVVSNPSAGFKQYNVYRSTDNTNYSLLTTQTNRLVNYYLDASAVQNTLYYYKVTSQDNSNNISFYSSALQGKANGTQDSGEGGGGQPTITSVITASKTTQTATITWTTNTLSDSTVEYEASNSTPASYSSSQGVPSMVTSHSVTLRGLTPNTKYYFKVKSTDPSSLQGSSDNSGAGYSFTTNAGPSISAVTTPNITNTTAQISWNTDTASDTFVIYSTNSSLSSPTTTGTTTLSSSGPPYSHTVNLSSLTGGTTYYY